MRNQENKIKKIRHPRNASTRKRSLKKVVKALPKGPNNRIEIVKSLANKFDLRIKMDHEKLGLPENALNDEEQTWLSNQSTEFIQYRCVDCSDLELNMDIFHNNNESITFHQWIRVDNKIQK